MAKKKVTKKKTAKKIAKKKTEKKVETVKSKPVEVKPGVVLKTPKTLHGTVVKLTRNGKKVNGILLSKDKQGPSDNLSFQWKSENGSLNVSEVTKQEVDELLNEK